MSERTDIGHYPISTIIQLSETTYLNLDAVAAIRSEQGQLRILFRDHDHALSLTFEEQARLLSYLHDHTPWAAHL